LAIFVLQIRFRLALPKRSAKPVYLAWIADLVPEFYTETSLETLTKEQSPPSPPHEQITQLLEFYTRTIVWQPLLKRTACSRCLGKDGWFSTDLGGGGVGF